MSRLRWRIWLRLLMALAALATGCLSWSPSVLVRAKELVNAQSLAVDTRTGRLFLLTAYYGKPGSVAVLDTHSGRILHVTAVGAGPSSVLADAATNRVFVLNGSAEFPRVPGSLSMLDAATGVLLHTTRLGATPPAMALDQQTNRLFVAIDGPDNEGYRARILMVNAANGSILRSVFVGHSPSAIAVDQRTGRVFVAGDYRTMVLDATSGALLRTVTAGIHPQAAVVSEETNRVFLLGAGGTYVDVLDAATGDPLGARFLDGACSSLEADGGAARLFAACVTGMRARNPGPYYVQLLSLDATSGRLVRADTVGEMPLAVLAVAPRAGRVFVIEGEPGLPRNIALNAVVYDARSGKRLDAVPLVGSFPSAAATDEATGHVFVLGSGGVSMLDATTGALLHTAQFPANWT